MRSLDASCRPTGTERSCALSALDRVRDREPHEHDEESRCDVEDEVVGSCHDGEPHGEGRCDREQAYGEVCRGRQEDDADDDVPAEMQAGEGRVLVRQPWRLERAIRVRLLGDGVDQSEFEHPRWRHGEKRKEDESDRSRDDEGVAEQVVAVAAAEEENNRGAEDHGPVTPDVDPVGEHDQEVVVRDRRL